MDRQVRGSEDVRAPRARILLQIVYARFVVYDIMEKNN
jgi:hypothetical protein